MLRHELIGCNIKIIESKNHTLVGLKGKIINETQNTITLQNQRVTKKIIKNQIKIRINNQTKVINGEDLIGRPYDRIRK